MRIVSSIVLLTASFILFSSSAAFAADPDNSALAGAADEVGSAVGGTLKALGKTLTDTKDALVNPKEVAQVRKEIDAKAASTLKRLKTASAAARALMDKSYGHAVFDTRKFSFMFTTGFGSGVLVEPSTKARTYMKMATGGANLGGGVQYYQIVFLFENKASLDRFANSGWEAGAGASGVFGGNSLAQNIRFVDGMAAFQLNDTGLMANLDVTGTKYYKSKELNDYS